MTKIEQLTKEQEQALEAYYQDWLAKGRSTKPIDLVEVEKAVEDLYSLIGQPKPIIVHCLSPYQLLIMPELYKKLGKIEKPNQLENQLRNQLGNQLGNQLENQLRNQLGNQLENQLRNQLGNQLWNQLWNQLRNQLENQLENQLGNQLENQLGKDGWASNYHYWTTFSNWYLYWLSFYEFPVKHIPGFKYSTEEAKQLEVWVNLNNSCAGYVAYEGICFVMDRPTKLTVDERGRLHNEAGPAIEYADGYSLYSWHGLTVESDVVLHPEKITTKQIDKEANAEVRRVLVSRFGMARYMKESKAKILHKSKDGILYRKDQLEDEAIVMVEVTNSTPALYKLCDNCREKALDVIVEGYKIGEKPKPITSCGKKCELFFEKYLLPVHPELRPLYKDGTFGQPQELTVQNAIASTFGRYGHEYNPVIQT